MTPPDRWREAAREIHDKDCSCGFRVEYCKRESEKTAELLRRLFPAREEWIGVEEPPKDCQVVLATRDGAGFVGGFNLNTKVCEYEVAGGIHTKTRFRLQGTLVEYPGVTHWQPLPAGPAESTESGRQKEERDGK